MINQNKFGIAFYMNEGERDAKLKHSPFFQDQISDTTGYLYYSEFVSKFYGLALLLIMNLATETRPLLNH